MCQSRAGQAVRLAREPAEEQAVLERERRATGWLGFLPRNR